MQEDPIIKSVYFSWKLWKVFAFMRSGADGIYWELNFYELEKLEYTLIEKSKRDKKPEDLHKALFDFFKRR